ncbi:ATP-binding protein [Vibrio rotiferianus]|uniref:ATP-binding protein n=1 Tax=Vibrio rotiferianus TaxID=190895 RepID=UPI0015F71B07|nr:ATP-binding protein [Vibrio rotiferianus]
MKRLISSTFRRRVLFITSLVGIGYLLTISAFVYHLEKDKLFEEYALDVASHVPAITNEIIASGQVTPLEKWDEEFPLNSSHFSMFICDENNNELWRSMNEKSRKQLLEKGITPPKIDNFCLDPLLPTKINQFKLVQTEQGSAFIAHVLPLDKTPYNPKGRIVLLRRMEDKVASLNQLKVNVAIFSIVASLIIMWLIFLVYRWSFKPFKVLEKELIDVKANRKEKLIHSYPEDLMPITSALNELMFQQKENEQRYRRALNDLAHSLKTRVAVSQALLDDIEEGKIHDINQQLLEMDDVIQGQLKRASLGVKGIVENATPIKPILNSLLLMFDKVHMDKGIHVEQFINSDQTLPMSKADVMEVFGNILENAYRYAEKRIDVFINNTEGGIVITFNNDGPAIDNSISETLFKRGVRADEKNPGTGLGLALCDEIVHSYKGAIWFETPTDPSMGASLKVLLPYR